MYLIPLLSDYLLSAFPVPNTGHQSEINKVQALKTSIPSEVIESQVDYQQESKYTVKNVLEREKYWEGNYKTITSLCSGVKRGELWATRQVANGTVILELRSEV